MAPLLPNGANDALFFGVHAVVDVASLVLYHEVPAVRQFTS